MLQNVSLEEFVASRNANAPCVADLSAHYDALLHRIQAANVVGGSEQSIGVISCSPQAGVSTVSFNIAIAATRAGLGPVLLIDADINKPPVANGTEIAPLLGLADALDSTTEPLTCPEQTHFERLSILSGRGLRSPALSRIDCRKFSDVLRTYKSNFKLLIIDIPAPTEVNNSISVAAQLDGVVIVLEAERADARVALRLKQQLVDANAKVIGAVLNKRRHHVPRWLYRLL